jgi:hypothetical protein
MVQDAAVITSVLDACDQLVAVAHKRLPEYGLLVPAGLHVLRGALRADLQELARARADLVNSQTAAQWLLKQFAAAIAPVLPIDVLAIELKLAAQFGQVSGIELVQELLVEIQQQLAVALRAEQAAARATQRTAHALRAALPAPAAQAGGGRRQYGSGLSPESPGLGSGGGGVGGVASGTSRSVRRPTSILGHKPCWAWMAVTRVDPQASKCHRAMHGTCPMCPCSGSPTGEERA